MPGREELPSTLQRSPAKARETWVKAHDSAVSEYGEGERAHRTAFGALKHSFEKVGDHPGGVPAGPVRGLQPAPAARRHRVRA
jgi:ChaB